MKDINETLKGGRKKERVCVCVWGGVTKKRDTVGKKNRWIDREIKKRKRFRPK